MSSIAVSAITDASGGNTASINGATPTNDNLMGRNRIINGDMRIDQRNAGAAVTPTTSAYTLDRWRLGASVASKVSVQRSTVAPVGFTNSTLITSLSAYTMTGTEELNFGQRIEGFNSADLGWGTANAKPITFSFWVRSSLTGLFSGSMKNNDSTRAYVFSYTISAANTWEYKTVTVAGDTTGTWKTDSDAGIIAQFCIASAANLNAAGVWYGTNTVGVTGTTQLVATSGATFYITGVQLEAGSVATPFERRQYGQELALCRRYLPAYNPGSSGSLGSGMCITTTSAMIFVPFDVPARVTPNGLTVSSASHFLCWQSNTVGTTPTSIVLNQATSNAGLMYPQGMSGLVAGNATNLLTVNSAAQILFNGCEL